MIYVFVLKDGTSDLDWYTREEDTDGETSDDSVSTQATDDDFTEDPFGWNGEKVCEM